jgi:branched-chain amino acid aminotransferase
MPSKEIFMKALQLAVQKNVQYLPPPGDGVKLYLRPMLMGTGQQLGLYPSPEMSFIVYVSPTGNYFSAATTGLNIHLETKRSRASKGGTGSTKCAGNYGIALRPLLDCKQQGFNDNLFLELDTYSPGKLESAVVQEMSAANVFFVMKSGEIVTPSLDRGTILPGVTRDSVLRIIEKFVDKIKPAMVESTGQETVKASSRDLPVGEIKNATECFCTGTAAEICPIRRLATGEGEEEFTMEFAYGATLPGGPVTSKLLELLRSVMKGEITVEDDWLRDPFQDLEKFMAETK